MKKADQNILKCPDNLIEYVNDAIIVTDKDLKIIHGTKQQDKIIWMEC